MSRRASKRRTWARNEPVHGVPPLQASVVPAPQPAPPADAPPVDARAEMMQLLAEHEERSSERLLAGLRSALAERLQPQRDTLRAVAPPDGPAPQPAPPTGRITTASPYNALYAQMHPAMRAVRNEEVDHYFAAFMRAATFHDHAEIRRIQERFGGRSAVAASDELERDQYEGRATLAEGTTTAVSGLSQGTGGPLIPLPLANVIITARNLRAKFRPRVTSFTSPNLTLRVAGAGVATTGQVAEGASGSQTEPTNTSTLFAKVKTRAKMRASEESIEDSPFNIATHFGERSGAAIGAAEDVQTATSNGTAPNVSDSFDNATITAFAEATITVMTYADVVGLFFAVPEQYREDVSMSFFGNSAMATFLSTILDGNGRPIFTPSVDAPSGVGDTRPNAIGNILGAPFFTAPVAAGGLYAGALAFWGYLDGGGIRMRVLDQVAAATDDIEYRFTQRWDSNILLADAFRSMDGITSVA